MTCEEVEALLQLRRHPLNCTQGEGAALYRHLNTCGVTGNCRSGFVRAIMAAVAANPDVKPEPNNPIDQRVARDCQSAEYRQVAFGEEP